MKRAPDDPSFIMWAFCCCFRESVFEELLQQVENAEHGEAAAAVYLQDLDVRGLAEQLFSQGSEPQVSHCFGLGPI